MAIKHDTLLQTGIIMDTNRTTYKKFLTVFWFTGSVADVNTASSQ